MLENTLNDLYCLGNSCGSVAIVPVGITKFREGLYKLRKADKKIAQETLDIIDKMREKALNERKSRMFFASDEIYITAQREFPAYEEYETFDQIEDGIGMYAMFANDFKSACEDLTDNLRDVGVICGTLIADSMEKLFRTLPSGGVKAVAIENEFFGKTINVTGLLTGQDIINHVKSYNTPKTLILPRDCLRRGETVFLDGVTLEELRSQLPDYTIEVASGGYELIDKIRKN